MAAPLTAASISFSLYLSHNIATSPLISSWQEIIATLPCPRAGAASPRLPLMGGLPSPTAAAPTAAFPAALPMRDRNAPEIRLRPQALPHSAVLHVSPAATIPFRAVHAASRSEPGPAPAERRCAPASREIASDRASDQIAGTLAKAHPMQHPRHPRRCATHRVPRDTLAGRIPPAALQTHAAWPHAPPLDSTAPPRRALAGSEPTPAFVLTREPNALALLLQLLDAALHSAVRLTTDN